jgi:hypothetical protein
MPSDLQIHGDLHASSRYFINLKNVEKITVGSYADAPTVPGNPLFGLTVYSSPRMQAQFFNMFTTGATYAPANTAQPSINNTVSSAVIGFTDHDVATRVATAINHAVELCGGGTAPF